MKTLLFSAILFCATVVAPIASAETVVVDNGPGNFRNSDLAAFFYDADGTYVWLDGANHFVVLYYTDGTSQVFHGYNQSISGGLAIGTSGTLSGTFAGVDEAGRAFTASVSEGIYTKKVTGGSGRGGGYRRSVTLISGGQISYTY